MRRLLRYLRPYGWHVAGAVALLAAASAVEVVGPWLTQQALDEAIPRGDVGFLGTLAAGYAVAIGLGFLLQYGQGLLTTWLGQSVMYDLRKEVFAKFQELDQRTFDRTPTGRLMTRITSDIQTLNELFASGLVSVFGDVFTLLFILAAMLRMDWRLALVTFTVLPFVWVAVFLFRSRIRQAYRDIRVRLARINAFLHERFTGIRVVHLFSREKADQQRHGEVEADYLEAHLRSITYYALFFPVIEVFTSIALALTLWYGGARILDGAVTVGVVAAFLQYARRFFRPIQDLSEKYNLLQGAMASSERIFKLLDEPAGVIEAADPRALPETVRGEIEFRDVWFAYDHDEKGEWDWVLRNVSFRAAPGEKIAIVGHTGAGKSTLINLLMRFYDVQKGEVLLDGVPIGQIAVRDLRERIGLVLQDVFLFSRDVAYNLDLGADWISEDRVRAAARRIGAEPFIERLDKGYAQPLGERGASLSVGERQLVSFARALAFDPPILVLDEATSSVDSEIEARIEEATDTLLADRTSLVIAHRLSTVVHADRILVLHHGEVAEQGTHDELLAAEGLYARLYELQFAGVPRSAA
ncbi:MAG: ABC transporter ATP-binding protein/permease [Gemmatimonadetes bacterium]|nr:ABC transporter ATP-binding protein/permease [Gemmatimonadota bacterium]MBT8403760.1 ABC transporter ATP-binding protein/permease [Gemmatimonadota bacterium]NNK64782.1 ABC transporter ATP-binding protein [Gemmatimonadota bacterium]